MKMYGVSDFDRLTHANDRIIALYIDDDFCPIGGGTLFVLCFRRKPYSLGAPVGRFCLNRRWRTSTEWVKKNAIQVHEL